MFAIVPKSPSFFYYYYPASIMLCIALAAAFHHFRARLKSWDESFAIISFGLFAYFYPLLSAAALSGGGAFQHWMWFSTWR